MPVRQTEERGECYTIDHSKGRWGAIPEALLEDVRLGAPARLLAAWRCTRPDGWQVYSEHVQKVLGFGKDKFQAARRQLIEFGYVSMRPTRGIGGKFGASGWVFQPAGDGNRTGAGFSGSGSSGSGTVGDGSSAAGKPSYITKPIRTKPSRTKTLETTPPKVEGVLGTMGDRLNDLLAADRGAVDRVNFASSGATARQVDIAVAEVRRQVSGGRVRSVAGLAMQLAKTAALGAMQEPSLSTSVGEDSERTWRVRAAAAGSYVIHPDKGRLTVMPEGRAWWNETERAAVSGSVGLVLWAKVDSGELALLKDEKHDLR